MLPRRENVIMLKTEAYTDRIIKLYQYMLGVHREQILSKQILRSGTSIGANVAESRNAQSSRDFINKLQIALKEADETEYWLKKLHTSGYINQKGYDSMHQDNEEIVSILTAIIKTMKQKTNN